MLIDHVSDTIIVLAPTRPSYHMGAFEEVGSTVKSFGNLVKESAFLRWSINWFTRRKGESRMRPFTKIHTPSLSSKYNNNSSAAVIAVAEKIIFLCHSNCHRVILWEKLSFSGKRATFLGFILRKSYIMFLKIANPSNIRWYRLEASVQITLEHNE